MKSERKLIIQENRIKQLEKQLHYEKELVTSLEKENAELKKQIKRANDNNILLQNQAENIITEFKKEIDTLKSTKEEYSQLISETKNKRKHYENKMANLLKRFNRQI